MDKILVYGADWCGDCRRTKKFLEDSRIDYEYLDVESDSKLAQEARRLSGSKSIPVVVLPDTTFLVEPSDEELTRRLSLDPLSKKIGEGEEGMIYDVIIVGGGPAGVAAGVYAARKQLRSLLVTESFGGQSMVSADIQNWIGETHIAGWDLAIKLEAHLKSFPEIKVLTGQKVTKIKEVECLGDGRHRTCDFEVTTTEGLHFRSKSLIVASGARRRKLSIPGEHEFEGKGVAYCSTCDAPLFKGKTVAVVGGGNAGLEAVLDLLPYASKIYLLESGEVLKGDSIVSKRIRKEIGVEVIFDAQVKEIFGKSGASSVERKASSDNSEESNGLNANRYLLTAHDSVRGIVLDVPFEGSQTLAVDGIFVEIGSEPNSEIVKDLVKLDDFGQIIIDPMHASTNHPGIFAAGDVTNDPYKQNNISAGDGVRAALACYSYLQNRKKVSPASETGGISH